MDKYPHRQLLVTIYIHTVKITVPAEQRSLAQVHYGDNTTGGTKVQVVTAAAKFCLKQLVTSRSHRNAHILKCHFGTINLNVTYDNQSTR